MQNTLFKSLVIFSIITLLSACSATSFTSLFSNYNQQMQEVKQAQKQGKFQQALSLVPQRTAYDASYNLGLLEKARLEYLSNNTHQSKLDFEQAYQNVQKAQQAAKIQLSRGVENMAAVMSNDNATQYDIPFYEQSMLHSYQALNYLIQQDISGALVEVRRANLVQENALATNAKSLHTQQNKMSSQQLSKQYPSMSNAIGSVKNGFQNAYTFYLSGLLYEAAGQQNDAYIDYKKALEIYPNNSYLQQDVWRLATHLGMSGDITLFKNTLPREITSINNAGNNGQVAIIIENGIVPAKQEISLNLPIYTSHNDLRFYSVALPSYQNNIRTYSPLSIVYQGKTYQSEEIVRLQSLAAKQLKDQLPAIVTRQIARLIAKEEIRQQMARKGGDVGNIFASIYNIATEKADTRSWSTLPDSIHILKMNLKEGEHKLTLNINGTNQIIDVPIHPNRQTLVKLSAIGPHINYHTFNL
jgi:hypothetical protein